jgi:cytochrome c551/c552
MTLTYKLKANEAKKLLAEIEQNFQDNWIEVTIQAIKPSNKAERLALLKKSAGTIDVDWNISDESLRRENLYNQEI